MKEQERKRHMEEAGRKQREQLSCARERTRDCLGMERARSHARRACAGLRYPVVPSLRLGNRSPFALPPRPLSYGGASGATVLVARSRGAPSVTPRDPSSSRRLPLSCSCGSFLHTFSLSLSLIFFLRLVLGSLRCVSFSSACPPKFLALYSSLTLSRHPYRFKRGRSPFFLSATFFLYAPRPRTIFISTTCLAGWRLAISERASEQPTRFATGSTLLASRGTRVFLLFFRLHRECCSSNYRRPACRRYRSSSPMRDDSRLRTSRAASTLQWTALRSRERLALRN